MDLFEQQLEKNNDHAPLAERMRPQQLGDLLGQESLIGKGSVLATTISSGALRSTVFWGPPGTGKTTIARLLAKESNATFEPFSAVTEGVPQLRKVIEQARGRLATMGRRTVLFVDEIHRFNKAQQDVLLPHVEQGIVTLIGATTENPAFAVNAALLSRVQVFQLDPLGPEALQQLLRNTLTSPQGLGKLKMEADTNALEMICGQSHGDARRALQSLQTVADYVSGLHQKRIKLEHVSKSLGQSPLRYDKKGEEHYNVISAFIKSMRGSDPSASVYWMTRMLEAGEDPLFISRRMLIFASEDIGNADPQALQTALATDAALRRLGMPESIFSLTQCCIYLAKAPKSNATLQTHQRALADVQEHGPLAVPMKLRNASTSVMKQWGYGADYRYPHDEGGTAEGETYLPEELIGKTYYDSES